MNPCKIVQDLLPLYVENICSESSREYVQTHLAQCSKCRSLHTVMNRHAAASQQNAKKSFASFKRKMLLRRILLITLCVVFVLGLTAAVLRHPIERYLIEMILLPTASIESTVYKLSDGSIYIDLKHIEEPTSLSTYSAGRHPENPNILVIQPYYQRFHHLNNPEPRIPLDLTVATTESYPKYKHTDRMPNMFSSPYTCVMLVGTDGERIIWQEGDELTAAPEIGERWLNRFIEMGYLVPVNAD